MQAQAAEFPRLRRKNSAAFFRKSFIKFVDSFILKANQEVGKFRMLRESSSHGG
jgi:hypothetical protein